VSINKLVAEYKGSPNNSKGKDVAESVNALIDKQHGLNLSAFDALKSASSRVIDVVMWGDSNQLFNGFGFDGAFSDKLTTTYGSWASPIYGLASGTQQQGGNDYSGNGVIGANTGAPTQLAGLTLASREYGYLASGTFTTGGNGLSVKNVTGVNVNSAWRFHYAYGTFDSGSGSFKVGMRRGDSPFSTVLDGPIINTNTGSFTYQETYLDLPAATRNYPIEMKWYRQGSAAITAPFLGYWCRAVDMEKLSGVSVHTFYGVGGASLYDFFSTTNGYTQAELTAYFGKLREMQIAKGFTPLFVCYVNSGINDRNETSVPSWGFLGSSSADSGAAYFDNLWALKDRIESLWISNGWGVNELTWLFIPSHPITNPDDAELITYRKGAKRLSNDPRCSFVNIADLITSSQMLTNGWYNSGGADTNHLTTSGYNGITNLILNYIDSQVN
jgi:hypothetical protein